MYQIHIYVNNPNRYKRTYARITTTTPKVIILDSEKNQHILQVNIEKSMNTDYGSFSFELAPYGGSRGETWLDIIPVFSYCEIYRRGRLKMHGVITWTGVTSSIQERTIRYTMKGSDLNLIFCKYVSLLTNKYLKGWTFSAKDISARYKQLVSQNEKASVKPLHEITGLFWQAFFEIFQAQRFGSNFKLSNGQTLDEIFGTQGEKYFVISKLLEFNYPLWLQFLDKQDPTLYGLVKSYIPLHFNDVWADTADGETEYYFDATKQTYKPKAGGFHFYARPALQIKENYDAAKAVYIPLEKTQNITANRSADEVYSIFLAIAQGHYQTSSAFSLGIPAIQQDYLDVYGIRILEANLLHAYSSNATQKGNKTSANVDPNDLGPYADVFKEASERLRDIYKYNDSDLVGIANFTDADIRIGQKLMLEQPVGNDTRQLTVIAQSVTDSINYMQATPIPSTSVTFIRGRYLSSLSPAIVS